MDNIPGRPTILSCRFSVKNISSLLDRHLQPISQTVNLFIKNKNFFVRKMKSWGRLSKGGILWTIDVVGFYPNVPHE